MFTVQDERARRRAVRLGQRAAGTVEVLEGIEAGEPVVRAGVQRLRDGVPVRVPDVPADGAPAGRRSAGA